MFPHKRSLVKRLAGKPFALIGVNGDQDKAALKEMMEKENITWRSFWNGEKGRRGPISAEWKVRVWPTVYVLDTQGKIRYKSLSLPDGKTLDKWVDTLLAEVGTSSESSETSEK